MKNIPYYVQTTTLVHSQNIEQVPLKCSSLINLAELYYMINHLVAKASRTNFFTISLLDLRKYSMVNSNRVAEFPLATLI